MEPPPYDTEAAGDESSKLIEETTAQRPPEKSSHWSSASTSNCMDWPYAFLFLANCCVLVGLLTINYDESYFKGAASNNNAGAAVDNVTSTNAFWSIGLALGSGIVLSILWLMALQTCPRTLIQAGLIFAIVMPACMAVACLLAGQLIGFLVMGVMSLCGVCWWYMVQSRIALAAKMLEISSTFITEYTSLILVSMCTLVVTVGYMVLWSLSVYCTLMSMGAINTDDTGNSDNQAIANQAKAGLPIMFYFFLTYFWGINVAANTLHVTTAGAFCEWWFEGEGRAHNKNKVFTSLRRATTSSFGSICYGSLLISIVQALEALVRQSERDDSDESALMCFLRCCALCILSCIEGWMQFINTYAFVHVALYGDDFCAAGSKTWDLFCNSGFDMIINQDLTQTALTVSAFGGAVLGGGLTYLLAIGSMDVNQPTAAGLAVMGGVITFGCMLMIMSLAMSVVAAIYVCYCEKPTEGALNHPEEFNDLVAAWREAYSGLSWYQGSAGQWMIQRPDGEDGRHRGA